MAEVTAPPRLEDLDRLSEDEFMELAPEKPKAELIDGVMMMSSPATIRHEAQQGFLFTVLRLYVEIKNLGLVLGPNAPVRLGPEQIFSPDTMFIAAERQTLITDKEMRGVPDFVVEFLSASTAYYDRGRKREVYEQAGLRELWLIDPYGPVGSRFYQRRDERFVEAEPLEGQINS
ncbi:MAG: Uma2 family endonuclease, partial [Anaerolineales bacterium]